MYTAALHNAHEAYNTHSAIDHCLDSNTQLTNAVVAAIHIPHNGSRKMRQSPPHARQLCHRHRHRLRPRRPRHSYEAVADRAAATALAAEGGVTGGRGHRRHDGRHDRRQNRRHQALCVSVRRGVACVTHVIDHGGNGLTEQPWVGPKHGQ